MVEIELEKTYLVKKLPEGLADCPHKEILDIYVPATMDHPTLRLRKKGDRFEITKKQPMVGKDSSEMEEHTIKLSADEFDAFAKIKGKRVRKIRYDYMYNGAKAEIDVFQDDLAGLVLADFEFSDVATKNAFKMPDFCLVDVTQEEIFAGGMLCGKKYSDVAPRLKELGFINK